MKNIAVVTGASQGIGEAITKKLSDKGYRVVGIYLKNIKKAENVQSKYKNVEMYRADVSSEREMIKLTDYLKHKYKKIDVLVNNAGIAIGGNIESYKLINWKRIINVNLTGKFLLCKYSIPLLKKAKGVIVNISSRGGLNDFVFPGFIAYSVSNAGINNLSLGLAKELKKDGIRVNVVIPTITNTDRFKNAFSLEEQNEVIKSGKLGTAEEAANLVYSLISDKTINGELLVDKRVYIKTNA